LVVATSKVDVEGDLTPDLVNLQNVAIAEAHIELPATRGKDLQDLDRPDDIVLVRHGKPVDRRQKRLADGGAAAAAEAKKSNGRRYVVVVNAPKRIYVNGPEIQDLEAGLSPNFRLDYDEQTRIAGEVRIFRGKLNVIGRQFEIQKNARVTFNGLAKRPFINITATYVNEREQVTVFVNIRGEGKDLVIKPSSQPPLPEADIYTLLATGRRTVKATSGSTFSPGGAASLVGSALLSEGV
jgi:translocation and assembly module TamB